MPKPSIPQRRDVSARAVSSPDDRSSVARRGRPGAPVDTSGSALWASPDGRRASQRCGDHPFHPGVGEGHAVSGLPSGNSPISGQCLGSPLKSDRGSVIISDDAASENRVGVIVQCVAIALALAIAFFVTPAMLLDWVASWVELAR